MNLVVGATGYIGAQLHADLKNVGEVIATCSSQDRSEFIKCDLSAPLDFDYEMITSGTTVFLTAALSSPDVCANDYERAWAVNVTGTTEFIKQSISRGACIIFFSSDTVYGEKSEEFDETATPSPAGEYAEMKYAVEMAFMDSPQFKSIRLSYVFSKDDKFTKYLVGCVEKGETASIFHPFYRSVIHRDDVVEGAIVLARNWDDVPQRIINFGGPEVVSRIEYAEALRDTIFSNLKFDVEEPDEDFFKNRPRVIRMQSNILAKLLGREQLTLQEASVIEFSNRYPS